jgi:hypothetical protein
LRCRKDPANLVGGSCCGGQARPGLATLQTFTAGVFPARVCYVVATMTGKDSGSSRGRFGSVLTDVQFWVPVAVLLAGLLLLEWIR